MQRASLPVVRTSNMATFRKCQRKAYLEVVCGEAGKKAEYLDFGTEVHDKNLRPWLERAAVPSNATEAGRVALKGLHLLPAPGPGLVVEEPFEVTLPNGVTFRSHGIDLYDARHGARIRLYDHKTCKSLRYLPTPAEMKENVQAISYARRLMHKNPEWGNVIRCRWVYYPRSKEPATAVDFEFARYELDQRWAAIVADVDKFKALAEAQTDWRQVTPNHDECDSYSGCQFRNRCAVADFGHNDQEDEYTMGLLERARTGEVVGASVSAPVPQAGPILTVGGPQPTVGGSLFAARAQSPQAPMPQAPPMQALLAGTGIEALDDEDEDATLDEGGALPTDSASINPGTAAAFAGVLPPDAAPADPAPPEPKKRGRKPKALAIAVAAEAPAQPAAPVFAAPSPPVPYDPAVVEPVVQKVATELAASKDVAAKLRKRASWLYAESNVRFNTELAAELYHVADLLERGEL